MQTLIKTNIFKTCQVVDAIDERVDAAVENGGEVKDVTQDWVDLTRRDVTHYHPFFRGSAPACVQLFTENFQNSENRWVK